MPGLAKVRSVQEFVERDSDQGLDRSYRYYSKESTHIHTDKQEVDLLETTQWGKMLFLDGTLQSSTKDEVIYHNALVHPLLFSLKSRDKILILGGGEGATAREVLRWPVHTAIMVDYDRELVEHMQLHGLEWHRGAFHDIRLRLAYECAWSYMKKGYTFDGVIIDLTDPNFLEEKWEELLTLVIDSVREAKGGFVMNAGLYQPWNTLKVHCIVKLIQYLCLKNPEFKYHVYTAFVPSFNGEWTFITVKHRESFVIEPEHLDIIPEWIRRSIRTLPDSLIESVSTKPITNKFIISNRDI
jgi:spermidine synthase